MILVTVLFGAILCLVTLRTPALGLGLAAAADLVLMEGIEVAGGSVAPESFFFIYLAAIPFLQRSISRQAAGLRLRESTPYLKFFGAFASVCVISALLAGSMGKASDVLFHLPLWFIFGLTPVWLCRTERDIYRVAVAVVVGCLLLLAGAIIFGLPSAEDQGGLFRTGYLNPLGHGLALGSVLAFGASFAKRWGNGRNLLRLAALALVLGTMLTHSRGGMVAGFTALFAMFAITSPGRVKSVGRVAGLAFGAILLFAIGTGTVSAAFGEFSTQEASSNLYRLQIVQLAVRLFAENPVFGAGLGNMGGEGFFLASDLRSLGGEIIANDNDYARILAELGSLGVAVLLLWYLSLRREYRGAIAAMRSAGQISPAIVMGAGVCVYLLALGLFESVYFSATGWFYVGFTLACLRVYSSREQGARKR
jgi:O-antigen ligase